jgi:hypothetical protein
MPCNYKCVNQTLEHAEKHNIHTARSRECKSIEAQAGSSQMYGRPLSLHNLQSNRLRLPADHAVSTYQLETEHKLQLTVRTSTWKTYVCLK